MKPGFPTVASHLRFSPSATRSSAWTLKPGPFAVTSASPGVTAEIFHVPSAAVFAVAPPSIETTAPASGLPLSLRSVPESDAGARGASCAGATPASSATAISELRRNPTRVRPRRGHRPPRRRRADPRRRNASLGRRPLARYDVEPQALAVLVPPVTNARGGAGAVLDVAGPLLDPDDAPEPWGSAGRVARGRVGREHHETRPRDLVQGRRDAPDVLGGETLAFREDRHQRLDSGLHAALRELRRDAPARVVGDRAVQEVRDPRRERAGGRSAEERGQRLGNVARGRAIAHGPVREHFVDVRLRRVRLERVDDVGI